MDNKNLPAATQAKTNQGLTNTKPISLIDCRTVRDVLKSGQPQVSALVREHGAQIVQGLIELQILRVVENVNVGKYMTPNQMKFAAELIAEKFWYLKLEDFVVCFKNGIVGQYGKDYDRVDVTTLCSWINAYEVERNETSHRLQVEQGKDNAKNIMDIIGSDVMTAAIRKVVDEQAAKLVIKESPKPEPLDPFAQWLELEWDRLYIAQEGKHGHGIIFKYGLFFGRNDWMKYKYAQMTRITKEKC
jgi:hypothetical protein